jgi:hypothetical protein
MRDDEEDEPDPHFSDRLLCCDRWKRLDFTSLSPALGEIACQQPVLEGVPPNICLICGGEIAKPRRSGFPNQI